MSTHIEDLLSAYMDNELNDSERQQVEGHLQTCSECWALHSDLTGLKKQVFTVFHSIEAPEGFEDKVIHTIGWNDSLEHVSKGSKWLLVPLLCVLFVITIALVTMGSFIFKIGSIILKVTYNLMNVFGNILGSHTYVIVGLIGFSIVLIVASSLSIKHLLKTNGYKGANW